MRATTLNVNARTRRFWGGFCNLGKDTECPRYVNLQLQSNMLNNSNNKTKHFWSRKCPGYIIMVAKLMQFNYLQPVRLVFRFSLLAFILVWSETGLTDWFWVWKTCTFSAPLHGLVCDASRMALSVQRVLLFYRSVWHEHLNWFISKWLLIKRL